VESAKVTPLSIKLSGEKLMMIRAFSLIELLIAMVLSVSITFLLGEIYINHEQSFKFQQGMMQASQNGILASNLIKTITENAGFVGCLSLKNLPINNHLSAQKIAAINVLQRPPKHQVWSHKPLAQNDLLQLNYMSHDFNIVLEDMHSHHYIHVSNQLKFKPGDILMISDCTHADIFKVKAVHKDKNQLIIIAASNLTQYHAGAIVGLWQTPILYIANSDRKDTYGKALPALYWHTLIGRDELLVEGVSAFKVSEKKINHVTRLTFNISTISDDVISQIPSNNNMYKYHVMQKWHFNDYLS